MKAQLWDLAACGAHEGMLHLAIGSTAVLSAVPDRVNTHQQDQRLLAAADVRVFNVTTAQSCSAD